MGEVCLCACGWADGGVCWSPAGNRFDDKGLVEVFNSLPRTLRVLDVSSNTMGEASITALAQQMGMHSFGVSEVCVYVCAPVCRHASV